jgi:hypothetical protein
VKKIRTNFSPKLGIYTLISTGFYNSIEGVMEINRVSLQNTQTFQLLTINIKQILFIKVIDKATLEGLGREI